MTLALDFFPRTDSVVHHLDPRWKLAAALLAVIGVVVLQTLPAAATALLFAVLLVAASRLPARWYMARVAAVGLFLSLFAVSLPFVIPGSETESWRLGRLSLSLGGVFLALRLLAKALAILTFMLVLLATAPLDATLNAAHALYVPGLLIQLVMLTVRYTFLIAAELARMRVALRVRGYRNRVSWHCYRTIGHVSGTLLVRGYERAERVGQAMRCRGFDGRFRSLTVFRTTTADVAAFVLVVGTVAGMVTWDRWLR
ncbi:MAG TPA: cobalt ECF transporter T component CbiQ [Gemmataceae bacterium]